MKRLVAIFMLWLPAFGMGCMATKVTPPAMPQDSVTVFLTDYGRHSSILIPSITGSGYDEWAFGDWRFFAIGDSRLCVGIRAMLGSPQATLGRRHIDASIMSDHDTLQAYLHDCRRLMHFQASRQRAEALELQLDTQFRNAAPTPLYSSYSLLYHVRDWRPYWVLHNCNHMTAHWLRRLGCDVCGPSIYSNFYLDTSAQPGSHSTTQPTTRKR
jgi:hypothetical protein